MKDFIEGLNLIMRLPLYLQVAVPCGYLGYLLARSGLNYKDKTITVLFLTLAFSLPPILTERILTGLGWPMPDAIQYPALILMPIVLGVLWRKWLNQGTMNILHWFKICNSTGFPNIWLEITQNQKVTWCQATVFLKNGQALSCSDLHEFKDAPIDRFRTDADGNVGLYVTDEKLSAQASFAQSKDSPIENVNGKPTYYRLTYIQKSEIERIEFVIHRPISS